MNKQDELTEHVDALKLMSVDELPGSGPKVLDCPVCSHVIVDLGTLSFDYDDLEKIRTWTVGQLIAWTDLQKRNGMDAKEMLERTSGGVMPGIGGALYGDVGTIGVTHTDGFFVGIEPDGYTHS